MQHVSVGVGCGRTGKKNNTTEKVYFILKLPLDEERTLYEISRRESVIVSKL